jgi:maleylpyruvate isomerase
VIRLYSYWRSSSSWRVRIALHHKALPFEYAAIHLLKGEQSAPGYAEKSDTGTVPLLEIDEGGQLQRISQSVAIIEYLEERFPNPSLLPRTALHRALARQLAETVNSGIQPFQNLMVLNQVEAMGQDKKAWAQLWIARGLEALEKTIARTHGRYSVGDEVSIADAYLIPQLYSARRFHVDVNPYPTLLAVESACAALPAFQAAHPDRQPDAQPA